VHNVAIQKASELAPPLREAVEQILGRPIGVDEEISIVAVPPQHAAPSGDKAAIVAQLETFLNRRAEKIRDVPADEINSVIDEAVRQVRRRRK
jgi:hypothetical protein